MKKIAILLLAILTFSCSDDDEKGTVEDKGQWAMIFNETVKSDSNPVDRTEKFMFDGERLIQHIIKRLSCNSWGIKFSQFPSCIYLC